MPMTNGNVLLRDYQAKWKCIEEAQAKATIAGQQKQVGKSRSFGGVRCRRSAQTGRNLLQHELPRRAKLSFLFLILAWLQVVAPGCVMITAIMTVWFKGLRHLVCP